MTSPYIHPYPDYIVEAIEDQMIEAFKAPFKPQPKRKPIVKLRMEREGVFEGLWKWKCRQCSNTWGTSGIWEYAINDGHTHAIMKHALPEYLASHHARNHHRSQP